MKETVSWTYYRNQLRQARKGDVALRQAAVRVRDAWRRGGAATEDMKAACSMIDMALRPKKRKS